MMSPEEDLRGKILVAIGKNDNVHGANITLVYEEQLVSYLMVSSFLSNGACSATTAELNSEILASSQFGFCLFPFVKGVHGVFIAGITNKVSFSIACSTVA